MTVGHKDMLAALNHPSRRGILKRLLEQGDRALSPKEISKLTRGNLPNISYHVRVLHKKGAVVLMDTEPVHGSIQHFYRVAPIVSETRWIRETLGLPPRSDE